MEYQNNLGSFLNLTRKELQELCKKNNLPANRSTVQLAKLLTSFFKVSSRFTAEIASHNLRLPLTEPKAGTTFFEGAVIEDNGCGTQDHSRTQDQLHNTDFMDHHTLNTPYDTGASAIHACKFNKESTYIVDWSLPDHEDMHAKSLYARDIQLGLVGPEICNSCYHDNIKNESQNCQNPRNVDQRLLVNTNKVNDAYLLSSSIPGIHESPIDVGYASSYESYTKATPSFDFRAMSDDGINLYVDLNCSTSGWIQKMNDDLCINQKIEHKSLESLEHRRDFLDVASKNPAEADRGTVFTNSSLGSVYSKASQDAYPLDATLASSESSILISSSNPVDTSNQVVSSSIFPDSTAIANTSTYHEANILHQDSVNNPSRVEQGDTGYVDTAVNIKHNSALTIYGRNNSQKSEDCFHDVKNSDIVTSITPISSLEREPRCSDLFGSCLEKSSDSCYLGGQSNLDSAAHLCQNHSSSLGDSVLKDLNTEFSEILEKSAVVPESEQSVCVKRDCYLEFKSSMKSDPKRSCNPEFDGQIRNNKRHHSDRSYHINKKGYLGNALSSTKENPRDTAILPRRSSRFLSK